MKQELPKPQDKIKQVIIKKTKTGCDIKHYGNPEPEEMNTLLTWIKQMLATRRSLSCA